MIHLLLYVRQVPCWRLLHSTAKERMFYSVAITAGFLRRLSTGARSKCDARSAIKVGLGARDRGGVVGFVVDDLEEQEGVHCVGGFRAAGEDADSRPPVDFRDGVTNIGL
jgi:hypothetical protein